MPNQNFNEDLREYANAGLAGTLPAQSVSIPANQSVNLAQVNGAAPAMNGGGISGTVLRVSEGQPATPAVTVVDATTIATAQTLIASSTSRQALMVFNDTTKVIILRAGTTGITTTSYSFQIPIAGRYEFPRQFASLPWQVMAVDAAAGTGSVRITAASI